MKRGPDQEDEHHIDHADQQDQHDQADDERGEHRVGAQDLEAASGHRLAAVRPGRGRSPPGADERGRHRHHDEGGRVND